MKRHILSSIGSKYNVDTSKQSIKYSFELQITLLAEKEQVETRVIETTIPDEQPVCLHGANSSGCGDILFEFLEHNQEKLLNDFKFNNIKGGTVWTETVENSDTDEFRLNRLLGEALYLSSRDNTIITKTIEVSDADDMKFMPYKIAMLN